MSGPPLADRLALAFTLRDHLASEIEAMAENARAAEEPDEAAGLDRAALLVRSTEIEGHLNPPHPKSGETP